MSQVQEAELVKVVRVVKEVLIEAPAAVVWESILEEIGPESRGGDGSPMPLKVELWPGGRWYRDLGNNTGHFWGVVQVVKPGKLLELSGPMFMSYPATAHTQYRLTEEGGKTRMKLTFGAIGLMEPGHAEGVTKGWGMIVDRIVARASKK